MDKKLLHLGLNLGPFTPNPHTLPSELSGTMKIFEGNDVYIQILNSDYLSTSPHFQKSDSVAVPRSNSNLNCHLKTGHFQLQHFEKPRFPCSESLRLD